MEMREDEESIDDNESLPDLLDDPYDHGINDPLEGTYFFVSFEIHQERRFHRNGLFHSDLIVCSSRAMAS